jgi:LPXTG-motif cell wall-anchored protein
VVRKELMQALKKYLIPALMLIVLGSMLTVTFAQSTILQTQPSCPTYQTNLLVDVVDSVPINVTTGGTVVTRIHVIYPDGTPVTLEPELVSFVWTGSQGQIEFDNVAVTYTGNPGFYTYTQQITEALVQATGEGVVVVAVANCSCSDGANNRGPPGLINSDLTLTPSDNSNVQIGPVTPPQTGPNITSYIVPLIVVILLIIALLLFLMRSRRKKK